MSGRKVRVAVVFGGRSTEHAISCVSAGSVLAALDREAYEVVPVGITPKGAWVLTSGDPQALRISGRELPAVDAGTAVVLPGDPTSGGLVVVEPGEGARILHGVDVVFPVLHGPYGEDGTIQGLLEMAGRAVRRLGRARQCGGDGQGVHQEAVAGRGAAGRAVRGRPAERDTRRRRERERLGLPVFVKPARGGSSIGITRLTDWSGLDDALAVARRVDPKVLVEAAVPGREVECGVLEGLDGGPPEASVPAEIRLVRGHDWYDFEAKYLDDACEFDVPADLPAAVSAELRGLAARAFDALDCAGLARVDFFVGAGGELTVNEVNTMPGFTPISMFPRMWAASGLDYPALLDRLLRTAIARGTGLR